MTWTAAGSAPSTGRGWAIRRERELPGECGALTGTDTRARRPQRRGHGRGLRRLRPGELVPGHPERRRPGDHSVVPPAGRRSGSNPTNATVAATNDWLDYGRLVRMSRILRPAAGRRPRRDHVPRPGPRLRTGKITYDVDNDGDGMTDSVWLDLGYPPAATPSAQLYKPLFAFMVIGLNGRHPAEHRRNLAGGSTATRTIPRTWATRPARSTRCTRFRMPGRVRPPVSQTDNTPVGTSSVPSPGPQNIAQTQLWNILTGHLPARRRQHEFRHELCPGQRPAMALAKQPRRSHGLLELHSAE